MKIRSLVPNIVTLHIVVPHVVPHIVTPHIVTPHIVTARAVAPHRAASNLALSNTSTQNGVTLMECLVTVALIAILAGIAVPTYQKMRVKQDIRQATVRIENSFARMKSYALMHQTEVVLCGSSNKTTCSTDWSAGYIQFEDENGNRQRDPTEKLLEVYRPATASMSYSIHSCSRRYFRTSAAGPLASIAGRIIIQPPAPHEHLAQHIIVSRLGRTRLETEPVSPGCG